MTKQVLIALGANIEPRLDHLKNAVMAFYNQDDFVVKSLSPVYETVPKGYADQDDFLNMVIWVETNLQAEAILAFCQSIEKQEKRVRLIKNGPRTIDVDILLIGESVIDTADLQVPHPRMHERGFVLFPANDIASTWQVPGLNKSIADLRDQLPQAEKDDVRLSGLELDI